jgi:hypothetical protein
MQRKQLKVSIKFGMLWGGLLSLFGNLARRIDPPVPDRGCNRLQRRATEKKISRAPRRRKS